MLKNPLPKKDFKKRKYFLMILKLKSAASNISPNSLFMDNKLHEEQW